MPMVRLAKDFLNQYPAWVYASTKMGAFCDFCMKKMKKYSKVSAGEDDEIDAADSDEEDADAVEREGPERGDAADRATKRRLRRARRKRRHAPGPLGAPAGRGSGHAVRCEPALEAACAGDKGARRLAPCLVSHPCFEAKPEASVMTRPRLRARSCPSCPAPLHMNLTRYFLDPR